MPDRIRNRGALIPLLQDIMKQRSSREWIARFGAANVPCGPINNYKEVFEDPQVRHRGLKIEMQHPLSGTMAGVASPMRFSDTPVEYTAPPMLGQHTREVLGELGYCAARIDELVGEGAVSAV
jgi:crotonobetainyl-CoA:carnitine CoA-transferase CaiB-like acyl-CoA transferase